MRLECLFDVWVSARVLAVPLDRLLQPLVPRLLLDPPEVLQLLGVDRVPFRRCVWEGGNGEGVGWGKGETTDVRCMNCLVL